MTLTRSRPAPAATEPSATASSVNDGRSSLIDSLAAHVGEAWGCKVRRVGRAHMLTAGERVVATAMLMTHAGDFAPYAQVDVPWFDWQAVVPDARVIGVPAFVVVRWADSVRFVDTAKIGPPVVLLTALNPCVRIQAGKMAPVTQGTRW